MPSTETMEMRQLVGKFALLFAFIYVLVLLGGVITLVQGTDVPAITWPLVVLPAFAFTPAVLDAVRLHRTVDPDRTRDLWRRCGLGRVLAIS